MRKLALLCALCGAAFAAQAQDAATLARGKAVFDYWCLACHGDGDQYPGTVALRVKYGDGVPAVLEQRSDLVPEVVRTFVRNGISVMPFFRKTEISDDELEALAQYLSSR